MPRYFVSPSRFARHFFHDCERQLRWDATPAERLQEESVPAVKDVLSPMTKAIVDGGSEWEERVVEALGTKVRVPPGDVRLAERRWSREETLDQLRGLADGEYLYQGTLLPPPSFLERFGLDAELLAFPTCHPDLVECRVDDEGRRSFMIIDAKASLEAKPSHRIQACLYALMLREVLQQHQIDGIVNLDTAAVWLYGEAAPEPFDLALVRPVVEGFLRERLEPILRQEKEGVPWHLQHRCEWCEFYSHCREEAETTSSVSLIPYLSPGARRHLRSGLEEDRVDTLVDLRRHLRERGRDAFAQCGTLRGKERRVANAMRALERGTPVLFGGSTVALPVGEQVMLCLTLQREPLGGRVYAAGFSRSKGKDIYGTGGETVVHVAASVEDTPELRRDFVRDLHVVLTELHQWNEQREWREQKSLQTYVFDGYEKSIFEELLLASATDPEVAEEALDLLFHFQDTHVAEAEDHPGREVPHPVVVVTRAIHELVALPSPVTIRLADALRSLPNPRRESTYEPSDFFSFRLTNPMKSDAIFLAWNKGRKEALGWIEGELKRRLWACGDVVEGLRDQLRDRLFAWPPKFRLPESLAFRDPLLSRVAFVSRYESFSAALAVRESRTRPLDEREREGVSVRLECLGDDRWRVCTPLDEDTVRVSDFPDRLLSPDDDEGERAQMAFDDHRSRKWFSAAKDSLLRFASVRGLEANATTRLVEQLTLQVHHNKTAPRPQPGERWVLHPRFTDFTSDRVLQRLQTLDTEPAADFCRLLNDPDGFSTMLPIPEAVRRGLHSRDLTPSQAEAFQHIVEQTLTLVWGPPGTGKTRCLAESVVRILAARRATGRVTRIALSAFTHAATENLLAEIASVAERAGLSLPLLKLGEPRTAQWRDRPFVLAEKVARTIAVDEDVVLAGTIYALEKATRKGLEPCDMLVVDEGSQMKVGDLAMAMSALARGGRLVIAGDDLQLPPILSGKYPEPVDGLPGLEDSVFAYLRARDVVGFTKQLTECWRMNRELCVMPAETLYGPRYRPATRVVAAQRLPARLAGALDPERPLVVEVLENQDSESEAERVADLVMELHAALKLDDERFWREGLFVVSPHHAHIRAVKRALRRRRDWTHEPFVDTVDKMQGQQAQAVIVSYGVHDAETAMREAEFIYSLNRLNVSVTRARAKCIVLLSRALLEPPFELLHNEAAARGLSLMRELVRRGATNTQVSRGSSPPLETGTRGAPRPGARAA